MLKPISADVVDLQPFRDGLVVDAQRIGHADGQTLRATERSHDLLRFRADGGEDIGHTLGNIVGGALLGSVYWYCSQKPSVALNCAKDEELKPVAR